MVSFYVISNQGVNFHLLTVQKVLVMQMVYFNSLDHFFNFLTTMKILLPKSCCFNIILPGIDLINSFNFLSNEPGCQVTVVRKGTPSDTSRDYCKTLTEI